MKELRHINSSFLLQLREKDHNFKVLVSDGAAYCTAVGKELQKKYPQLIHVRCLAHNVSLVCEELRNLFSDANEFVVEMRRTLLKNEQNQHLWRETTQLALPEFPSIIRWGTWIVSFHFCTINGSKWADIYQISKIQHRNVAVYPLINQ